MFQLIKTSIRDTFVYSLGNVFLRLSGFILLPLFLAHLTPDEYGVLGILEVSTQVLVYLFSLALYLPLMRWYWDKPYAERRRRMFFTVLAFSGLMTLLMFLLITPFASALAGFLFHRSQSTLLVRLMLLVAGLQIITQIPVTLLRVQGKAVFYTVSYLVNFVISTALTVFFIHALGMKVEGIYWAHACGYGAQLIILTKFILQNAQPRFDGPLLKEMLAFSFPIVLSSLAGILITIADRYVLNILGQLKDVGVYSLAFKIANTLNVLIISSANLALTPLIYQRMDDPQNKRFYTKVMTYMTFGVMFFVLGISLFGQEIIKLFAKNKSYWEAYHLIPILSFAFVFAMLKDLATIGLNITKKTKIIGGIVTLTSVINVGLNFLCVHWWQTTGAAIAVLVTYIVFFVAMYSAAQKEYHIPYEIGKILRLVLIGALLTSLGMVSAPAALWVRLLIKCGLIALFPVILYYAEFFEAVELESLKRIWHTWRNPLTWKMHWRRLKSNNRKSE